MAHTAPRMSIETHIRNPKNIYIFGYIYIYIFESIEDTTCMKHHSNQVAFTKYKLSTHNSAPDHRLHYTHVIIDQDLAEGIKKHQSGGEGKGGE